MNICYSKRSNEPYICEHKENYQRTASDYRDISWIISGYKEPNFAGYDIVVGKLNGVKINSKLQFLPSKDPLITSWVPLGPNLKILGFIRSMYRDAPPGMAIYTTPKLKEVWKTAEYFYFDKKNKKVFEEHEKNMQNFLNPKIEPVFSHNQKRFTKLGATWKVAI